MDESTHSNIKKIYKQMPNPEITVIVPVYNGEKHLRDTITSILEQSFEDFELLAIDDGSTDNSLKIVSEFNDKRVRLIVKENGGLCDTLNRGINEARSPYIARNDQDDISFPHRLKRQLEILGKDKAALALFAYNTKFGAKHGWSNSDKLVMKPGDIGEYDPIADGCLLGSTMFARTEALRQVGGFRANYYPSDDWDLECRLALTGKVMVLREPLVSYRFHLSANTYKLFAEMQNKADWTKDSYYRRRDGKDELSFEDFMRHRPSSILRRINHRRATAARLRMRMAGQNYLDGKYANATVDLSAAILLNPRDLLRRIGRMLQRPGSQNV